MRYLKKSAEVLNEADRFERVLNWRIFCSEQEQLLWAKPNEWAPGDPIFTHPVTRRQEFDDDMGEHPREIIQEIDMDCFDSLHTIYFYPRCQDCQVFWYGEYEPCWNCGELIPPYMPKNPFRNVSEYTYPRVERVPLFEDSEENAVGAWLDNQMRLIREVDMSGEILHPQGFVMFSVVDELSRFSIELEPEVVEIEVVSNSDCSMTFHELFDPTRPSAVTDIRVPIEGRVIEPPELNLRNVVLEQYLNREEQRRPHNFTPVTERRRPREV